MPTRNVVLCSYQTENRIRLKVLREAARVGIDDLKAARYRAFASFADLDSHLGMIANRAIAQHRANQKRN